MGELVHHPRPKTMEITVGLFQAAFPPHVSNHTGIWVCKELLMETFSFYTDRNNTFLLWTEIIYGTIEVQPKQLLSNTISLVERSKISPGDCMEYSQGTETVLRGQGSERNKLRMVPRS